MPRPPSPTVVQRRARGGKGIVRAIFAVTGVVDEVSDLILPGSFARTLGARRVKSVWHHEWKEPVGIVLSIEEWAPGDPRFATIPGGAVWPAGAGALVATVQFNLRTTRGRDAYEQVRQWHENGEAQFSIGYKVPPGGASKRHDGVRIIHDLDLYEISPVLHGAHPMTRSIEVKASAARVEIERKATWSAVELKAAEQQAGNGVMVALKVPRDVAEQIAQPDGTPAEFLHITLAYLGDVADLGGHPDDLRDIVAPAVDGIAPLAGSIGGIGRFPDSGDGEPTWVPVDVPGLAELRQQVVQALAGSPYSEAVRGNHGFTPHITLGYDLDDVDPVPTTPVTFPSVWVVRGGDEMEIPLAEATAEDDEPTGPPSPEAREFAENVMRTHDSLPLEGKSAAQIVMEAKASGGWDRNKGNAENLRHWYTHGEGAARIGWGSPGDFDRCVAIAGEHMSPEDAKGYCNLRHHDAIGIYPATHAALEGKSAAQVVLEAKSAAQPLHLPERIMTTPMPYSFEQLRDQLCKAVRGLFAPDRDDDHGPGPTVAPECYVSVEATYPDRVIVTRYDDGNTENYSVPYTLAGRDVELGTPTRVELTTVATPISGGERDADPDEVVQARVIQPTGRALEDATALIQVSDAGPEHLQSLKPTITSLLNALSKKGMPMDDQNPDDSEAPYGDAYAISDGWDDDEEDPGTFDELNDDAYQAPGGDGMPDGDPDDSGGAPDGDADDPEEQDKVRLDAAEVKAALAQLAL
ncbi:2'-5' RNA ligase family protein [Streptomyces sp. MC1]|uniref:2'-5' RNA ligase family protein n=1 Tax=Streptomyces sp. MC1 TaxID=295105 RepID=UPI0018CB1D50|nr:2'-5' RNA ligase family protein [Streptomyces sp. MC1]MBG7704929.1 2'-5' RNA ligase family protein [Streptomyces sp. MC1]